MPLESRNETLKVEVLRRLGDLRGRCVCCHQQTSSAINTLEHQPSS